MNIEVGIDPLLFIFIAVVMTNTFRAKLYIIFYKILYQNDRYKGGIYEVRNTFWEKTLFK